MPVKIALSGATGFIGRHVVSVLEQREMPITVICRSAASVPESLRKHRLIVCGLDAPSQSVSSAMEGNDTLIHLAWGGLPNYGSLRHFEEELPLQFRFLRNAVAAGIRSVVITGSCLEYGNRSGELHEIDPVNPTTPYGFAKDALRRQLEFLQLTHKFDLTWCRLFYTFGAGQSQASIYSQLCAAIHRGDATFPMSRGEQLRDFLPIEDVARVIVELAVRRLDAGIVNVCSGEPISIRRLVEQWLLAHGWNITLRLGEYSYPSYEPLAFWGSRTKLDSILAKRPEPAAT